MTAALQELGSLFFNLGNHSLKETLKTISSPVWKLHLFNVHDEKQWILILAVKMEMKIRSTTRIVEGMDKRGDKCKVEDWIAALKPIYFKASLVKLVVIVSVLTEEEFHNYEVAKDSGFA
ncbi:hypothetical protein Scep_013838 [Stephania cephalantha]|uniref:Uncharacterized protein n=1 Tax=Stephania cephalantha TaxID=152367 RepID=A0AAP0IZV6_9MAGN